MDNPFGWDLFFNSIKNDIRNNQDLLIGLTHFALVSNGFKCIGLGESKVLNGDETKTETLPEGWTDNYSIRYVYQGVLYNFVGTDLEDAVMINLIRSNERQISFIQLNTRSVLKRTGTLKEMIPDFQSMMETIKKQLIDKVIVSKNLKDGSTQTPTTQPTPRPLAPQPSSEYPLREDRNHFPHFLDPVGTNDLNPFGIDPLRIGRPNRPAGGGMLFQPPGGFGPSPLPSGLPPGAVPPGARFDPFRPPDVDRWNNRGAPRRPDNDEYPPPGYDDMFM